MEEVEKKQAVKETEAKEQKSKKKKVSKTLEAARRLKGSLIVNDPKFLL